jgi:4-amino-4-deoxy-L-arabinose transferase-like glycosyltransferase
VAAVNAEIKSARLKPLRGGRGILACLGLLVVHVGLVVYGIPHNAATVDEGGHVLAGAMCWQEGAFHVYRVNPPLVKMLAAIPLAYRGSRIEFVPGALGETAWLATHERFMHGQGADYHNWIFRARLVMVLFSVAAGALVYSWSRELFGDVAGVLAAGLWAFSPMVLAFAGLVTMDVPAAASATAVMYTFWRYLRCPSTPGAVFTGLALGIAALTKFSLLVLYPVLALVWLTWLLARGRTRENTTAAEGGSGSPAWRWSYLVDPMLGLVASLLVINAGYGFGGSMRPLGSFALQSELLTRPATPSDDVAGATDQFGRELSRVNRFRGSWLASLPVPLPQEYLLGLDEQKAITDLPQPAYLRGEWRDEGGWWYYYLYGLLVKVPLGTWLLGLLAGWLAWRNERFRAGPLEELMLWLPPLVFLVAFSSQTNLNKHLRYVMPIFPFLIVSISRTGLLFGYGGSAGATGAQPPGASLDHTGAVIDAHQRRGRWGGRVVVVVSMTWCIASALWYHPHSLAYFNEYAGGPDNGWRHLLDSNLDWGQDLLALARWAEQHPEAAPLGVAYYGVVDPRVVGLEYRLPPRGPDKVPRRSPPEPLPDSLGPQPGWYAVSINFVCGKDFMIYDGRGVRTYVEPEAYRYFRHFTPDAKAGYSIYIYHVTPLEADRVRRLYELPSRQSGGPAS